MRPEGSAIGCRWPTARTPRMRRASHLPGVAAAKVNRSARTSCPQTSCCGTSRPRTQLSSRLDGGRSRQTWRSLGHSCCEHELGRNRLSRLFGQTSFSLERGGGGVASGPRPRAVCWTGPCGLRLGMPAARPASSSNLPRICGTVGQAAGRPLRSVMCWLAACAGRG